VKPAALALVGLLVTGCGGITFKPEEVALIYGDAKQAYGENVGPLTQACLEKRLSEPECARLAALGARLKAADLTMRQRIAEGLSVDWKAALATAMGALRELAPYLKLIP
jgi:hypothetical protein